MLCSMSCFVYDHLYTTKHLMPINYPKPPCQAHIYVTPVPIPTSSYPISPSAEHSTTSSNFQNQNGVREAAK